jgi:hypothetical protein
VIIYHLFADRGIESEVLSQHGRVVRVGLEPKPNAYSEAVAADLSDGTAPFDETADLALLQPPCTRWSSMVSIDGCADDHPNLIDEAREIGEEYADEYIIENVPRAPLDDPTVLSGDMFGLPIEYERAFETSFGVRDLPAQVRLSGPETTPYLYADHAREWWAAAKGYSDEYPKQAIAKNCIPAPYLHFLLREWHESRGRGHVEDYTKHESSNHRRRQEVSRLRAENATINEYGGDAR